MSLTRFAVRYPPVIWLLLIALMGLGVLALKSLSRREDPDLSGRVAQIIAIYPGATSSEVEELVSAPLERTLLSIDDIKVVESTSRMGMTVLTAVVADRVRDQRKVWEDVRKRVSDLRKDLPQGVLSVDVNDRFFDTSTLVVGVTWDGATDRQREDIAKRVRDHFRRLPDVADVFLIGEQAERVTVFLSSQRMSQFNVTPSQVSAAIARRNVLPASGGSLALGATRLSIQPTGNLLHASDMENLVVTVANGVPVHLRDIASIKRGYADPPADMVRIGGKPAVAVSFTMRKGGNITTLGQKAHAELAALRPDLPHGAQLHIVNDLPQSVERRMAEFFENLIAGIVLIFVVMYLFMGMRSALLVGVMLPMTILGTFAAMFLYGRDIQQISITSLIIALGLVVDNSIVIMDNIDHKLHQGCSRLDAVVNGVDDLRIPLLTSNLTTIASFFPLSLLSGGTGEFLQDLGVVTTLAVIVSLLLNYTVAPLIALYFMDANTQHAPNFIHRAFSRLIDNLRDMFAWMGEIGLRHARMTVCLAIALFAWTGSLVPSLGTQFLPSAERNQFVIDVWLPEGRDIRATEQTVTRVSRLLQEQRGITSYIAYIGRGGPRFYYNISPEAPAANYAQIVVNTESIESTKRLVRELQQQINLRITDARVVAKTLEQGPPIGPPVAVRISGDSVADLRQVSEQVMTILNDTPGTLAVHNNYGETPLALRVKVDQEQAALAGVTSEDIAQITQMGYTGMTVSYLRENDTEIPIQLRLERAERGTAESVSDIYIPTSQGTAIPLRQVAKLYLTPQDGRIVHRNNARTLTVLSYVDGSRLPQQVLADASKRIDKLRLPPSCSIGYGGEQEEMDRSFTEMILIFGLSIISNLLIVVWEFNSVRIAFTIFIAVPLGMTGAILGLLITGKTFGMMAFLGITALGGVITNHEIVLFEYALREIQAGNSLDKGLLEAGRKRLRPILLTVALSIGGLLPQALHGGNLWPPMAWALIFGLLFSMVQTLVTMRAFYKLLAGRASQAICLPESSEV